MYICTSARGSKTLTFLCILYYIAFRLHMYIRPFLRSFWFFGVSRCFWPLREPASEQPVAAASPQAPQKNVPKDVSSSFVHTYSSIRRRNYNGTYNRSSAFGDDPPRAVVRRLKATDILHTTSMYLIFKRKTKTMFACPYRLGHTYTT